MTLDGMHGDVDLQNVGRDAKKGNVRSAGWNEGRRSAQLLSCQDDVDSKSAALEDVIFDGDRPGSRRSTRSARSVQRCQTLLR